MANINSQWLRGMAVSCNHGQLACKQAQKIILEFKERWKPDVVVDLGDVHDFAAFRSGAKGTKDEFEPIELDYNAGVDWLERYRPTHRCLGNHDDRIVQLATHRNAIVAHASGVILESLRRVDEKNNTQVKPYHPKYGWWQFGDVFCGHGWMYNENAIRDHAETFGNKRIIGHLHGTGYAEARHLNRAACWCVGAIIDPDKAVYAKSRRATLRWNHGIGFWEFNRKHAEVWLQSWNCENGRTEQCRFLL